MQFDQKLHEDEILYACNYYKIGVLLTCFEQLFYFGHPIYLVSHGEKASLVIYCECYVICFQLIQPP